MAEVGERADENASAIWPIVQLSGSEANRKGQWNSSLRVCRKLCFRIWLNGQFSREPGSYE